MVGRDDGEHQLDTLRTIGMPIERQASRAGSYRYLRPVREVLEVHALREVPRERASALRIADEWYSGRKRAFEAAWCWVRLDDWDRVIHVILVHLQQILDADEIGQLAELVAPTGSEHSTATLAKFPSFSSRRVIRDTETPSYLLEAFAGRP